RLSIDRSEVVMIPAAGGSERKLTDIRNADDRTTQDSVERMAWTPDGRHIAISHRENDHLGAGLFLISVLTGEKKQLMQPPPGYSGDFGPAFSQSGRSLLFTRGASEVYMLPLDAEFMASGQPQRLIAENRFASNAVWTNDGDRVLYKVTSGVPARQE